MNAFQIWWMRIINHSFKHVAHITLHNSTSFQAGTCSNGHDKGDKKAKNKNRYNQIPHPARERYTNTKDGITYNKRQANRIRAATWQNQQSECAPSEDSDQPVHPPNLIRVFAVRLKKPWVLSYPLSAQRRLIRLGGCPGWSESSLGAHSFCWCCHVSAQVFPSRWLSSSPKQGEQKRRALTESGQIITIIKDRN